MSNPTDKIVIESRFRSHITAVAFTSDGHIFGGDEAGEIYRWRIRDAQQVGPIMKASGFVESISVSGDGHWLVTGDDGRRGIVWNAKTHEKVFEVTEHTHFVYAVDIASDSTRFATGSCDKTVRIFCITTGVRLIPPLRHDRAVLGLKFSPDGDLLAISICDVCVRVYDPHSGDRLFDLPIRILYTPATPLAWSFDSRDLFVVSQGKLTCYNTSESSSAEWSIKTDGARISVTCTTDGMYIACSSGSLVYVWDVISREQIGPVIRHVPSILCISLSSHERILACGHGNKISIHRYTGMLPEIYILPPSSSLLSTTSSLLDGPAPTLGPSRVARITELYNKHASSAHKRETLEGIIIDVFNHGPLVLIDVATGRLYDRNAIPDLFRTDPIFEELVSSMTGEIDEEHIRETAKKYFGYVMLSHVWGNGIRQERNNEPLLQVVKFSGSVYNLPNTPMNDKLRNFCTKVAELGYRWAWSDTCCIDRSSDATISRSIRSMYKWYGSAEATLVFLADVSSDLGSLLQSQWMTRSWTLQEALVPRRILFYDRDWRLYRDNATDNHKGPGVVLQELADATGVSREILSSFHSDSLDVRAKLRLASKRSATLEEDVAYSLIGMFKSHIHPRYGEGEAALGHLLEEIVAHTGDATIFAWNGSASSYNSCLPSGLAVYSQKPSTPTLNTNESITYLSTTMSKEKVINIYRQIDGLPPVRFTHRRIQLPCIMFRLKSLVLKARDEEGNHYHAEVFGLGTVEFETADRHLPVDHRRLAFVNPWIKDIRGLYHEAGEDGSSDSDTEVQIDKILGANEESRTPPPDDEHVMALKTIVGLVQPFKAILLLQRRGGEYQRVAAENEIIAQVSKSYIRSKGVSVQVLDVL